MSHGNGGGAAPPGTPGAAGSRSEGSCPLALRLRVNALGKLSLGQTRRSRSVKAANSSNAGGAEPRAGGRALGQHR